MECNQDSSSLSKKNRKDEELGLNMISRLPPSIIETILCYIPIKEAARTCILSKEWRYTWTSIPKLVFTQDSVQLSIDENQLPDHRQLITRKLVNAIDQVMSRRQAPILDFTLEMDADDNHSCVEVDRILTHLSRNNNMINRLSIELTHGCRLPLDLFWLPMLTDLYLRNCDVNHPPVFSGFRTLTSFCLHDVNIFTKTLLHLLSNSPLLKTFTLLLSEDNMLSNEFPTIIELFQCLPLIEHFTSWGWLIPCFAHCPVPRVLPTTLPHLKSLSLDIMCFIDKYDLPFLIMLIRSSPNLAKLVLKVIPEGLDAYWKDDLDYVTKKKYSDVWLEHLNEFEIAGFSNLKPEMDFVKLILVKSPVLKKARIILNRILTKDEEILNLKTTLLHSPHASPEVEISVERPEYEKGEVEFE